MADLTDKRGCKATPQSQYEFQLTSIETGLFEAIASILDREAANQARFADCTAQRNLIVTRVQNGVKLLVNGDADSNQPSSLQIAPLFPGSYSQSEITVSGIHSDSAHKANWAVMPPELYFSRFTIDTGEDSLITDRNGINMAVIMPPDVDVNGAEKMGLILRTCPVLNRVTRVTILPFSGKRLNSEHDLICLVRAIAQSAGLPAEAKIHCERKPVTDCHGIIHQLNRHDIAFCPTAGLAIDAMNCGCACIFPEYTCKSPWKLLPANATNDSASHLRSALGTTAREQREQLVIHQKGCFPNHLITPWLHELADAVQSFCLCSQPVATAPPCSVNVSNRNERVRVISPSADLSQTSVSRLSGKSDSTRRKLLKLYHSPRQFFSDSQRLELQLIARFLKGIDQ